MALADNPMGESCGMCACFLPIDEQGNGLCRRNPPQLVLGGLLATPVTGKPQVHYASTGPQSYFPVMKADGWCYSFVAKGPMQ